MSAKISFATSLLPVKLQLQFVTDKKQASWSIKEDFSEFPEIEGERGNLHRSWDIFIRNFVHDNLFYKKFGNTEIKEMALDSKYQEEIGNFFVTVKFDLTIENREAFEYFINQEYFAYHSKQNKKKHVFYAYHLPESPTTLSALPTLKNQFIKKTIMDSTRQDNQSRFITLVNSTIESENVKSPECQPVKDLPGLSVNYALTKTLHNILKINDTLSIQSKLREWIQDAIQFRINELDGELLRLTNNQVNSMAQYIKLPDDLTTNEKRIGLFLYYKEELKKLKADWYSRVVKSNIKEDLDQLILLTISSIRKQADIKNLKVRELSSFPIRKIAKKISDKENVKADKAAKGEEKELHNHTIYTISKNPTDIQLQEMAIKELFEYYAPDIVQSQQVNQLRYNPTADQIGKFKLIRNKNNETCAFVDVSLPAVYTHARKIQTGEHQYIQLTYEFWYPQQPEMYDDDKKAGLLDGRFLTITLNENNIPVIYETAMNSGHFYEIYITEHINKEVFEQISENSFPTMYNEKPISGILNIDKKLFIIMSAGFHRVTKLDNVIDEALYNKAQIQPYYLEDVETLELLPFENSYASIYHTNGLIRNGGRPESYLLWIGYPENYFAGWNRHQSQRRYGINPETDGFHNPFWITSLFLNHKTPSFLSGITNTDDTDGELLISTPENENWDTKWNKSEDILPDNVMIGSNSRNRTKKY